MKTKLQQTTEISNYKTDIWNDSCSIQELTYSLENSDCTGATNNPVIVGNVLKKEFSLWEARIYQIIKENQTFGEIEVTWQLIEEMTQKGAELLKPIFQRENSRKGRISIQVNPKNWRDAEKMWKQAVHFDSLADNIIVKIPVTSAGIVAIEEATFMGVNINATICFSVPQCVAVAEAVERGLKRREKNGKDISNMTPVCTLMVGRQDDWLKIVADKNDVLVDPGLLDWPGVAAIKKSYEIFKKREFKTRLLAAAYRNHLHWSELIGGDLILTIPYNWQVRFNGSDIEVKNRFNNPIEAKILQELADKFPNEWKKGYQEDGLTVAEFDSYGAVQRTLRGFIQGYDALVEKIRNIMIPDPDV